MLVEFLWGAHAVGGAAVVVEAALCTYGFLIFVVWGGGRSSSQGRSSIVIVNVNASGYSQADA